MEEQKKGEPAGQKPAPKTVSEVLQTAQIALDTYDDIFSDFDPSPYERRLISDDLLKELHRRYPEAPLGDLTITFTMPHSLRSEKVEALVKKRLKDYFKFRLKGMEKLREEKMRKGAVRLAIGIALSLLLIVFPQLDVLPVLTTVSVLIWYVLWTGFEYIFEAARRLSKKHAFYDRLLRAQCNFVDQEEVVRSITTSSSYR
ncbi:MAG: hypothetical protein PHV13_01490 [Candidatus ainarchaeum sp.]|nr:hypothetical protein [Candidatus ainarchaeum sp.]